MQAPTGAMVQIFDNLESMAETFAYELVALAERRIKEQGGFNLALTGGQTPRPLYRRVSDPEFARALPWDRVKIFWGDERAVGPTHPDSNFKMAWDEWLHEGWIPPENIHRMEGEAASLPQAAQRYSELLTRELPDGPDGFPQFDLILLGMGDDGHVASLFPGSAALDETLRVAVANEAPRLHQQRLTLTFPTINAARDIWFLVTGGTKAERAAQALGYLPGGEYLPATLVHGHAGHVQWWLDRAAAAAVVEAARLSA